MPRIFDNIEKSLLPTLQDTLKISERADFCVGYFNLRGWREIEEFVDTWRGGPNNSCRLLIGMQTLPQDEFRNSRRLLVSDSGFTRLDQQTAEQLKRKVAEEFRTQLTIGAPTNTDEQGLRCLSEQIKAQKVQIKLFLRHPLHAKLYLLYRPGDPNNPITGFLGSSNLTFAGLAKQGELNVDVVDHDACLKLSDWFEDRWNDRWCLDISKELVEIIDSSWAKDELTLPYHIYLKMAYHLSQEARAGLAEYSIPRDFKHQLFDFQVAAVKMAAKYLNKRGGVMIGDVVGLGKTMMATTLARIFQDDYGMETLIICPKNLVPMWEDYVARYRLLASVMPISMVTRKLKDLRRYKLVLIDESHNLRNREGKRFKAIADYITVNDSKCILLTATPYNKTFLDLSAQLRLFVSESQDLGIRPEKLMAALGEPRFKQEYQCMPRTLAAFEKSENIDDWRDLMRLFLVRRTRSFIQKNYAQTDKITGRPFLTYADGSRSYFPVRVPKTIKFNISDVADPYARLYADDVVNAINSLRLPRYGLGGYVATKPEKKPSQAEKKLLDNLGRARQRLVGFSRTNLFKRLESGGPAFIQSIERHILRNFVFIYALENNLELPLGTQEAELLDLNGTGLDEDLDTTLPASNQVGDSELFEEQVEAAETETRETELEKLITANSLANNADANSIRLFQAEDDYRRAAAQIYKEYTGRYKKRFKWIRSDLFIGNLLGDLLEDSQSLIEVSHLCSKWDTRRDTKLEALIHLLTVAHPNEKVLIFSQFADTVRYLTQQLRLRGIKGGVAAVTGDSDDPTTSVWRFSPVSSGQRDKIKPQDEIRVLIATDVLSEGQNLQDAAIVVNYDLPWAIIRLIQRAGRVDRIGQQAEEIVCYTFMPAEGVEKIIRLRARLAKRLRENAEVVGTDESFFEDENYSNNMVVDLYNEKAGVFDNDAADDEVDLTSYAYQIWKNAIEGDKTGELKKVITSLPDVSYATRHYSSSSTSNQPQGVLMYVRTSDGNDALTWLDKDGKQVSSSQLEILKAAECTPATEPRPRYKYHHALVEKGLRQIALSEQEWRVGGQLGRPGSARYRTYERLKTYASKFNGGIFEKTPEHQTLLRAIEQVYKYPLRQTTTDTLNRQIKSGINDETLAELILTLYNENRLCIVPEKEENDQDQPEPQIICSMGLFDV